MDRKQQRDLAPEEIEALEGELSKRGTADVSSGVVNQVTQAISESESEVEFLVFGELQKKSIISIDKACANCKFWKGKLSSVKLCQERQAKDARARGFTKLICPEQFVD